MKRLIVSKKETEKKLNNIILKQYPDLSINTLNKALRKKDIRVNNTKVSENIVVYENDVIDIYISDNLFTKHLNINISDIIVFEDNNIIILNKPCGICVQSDTKNENSLEQLLTKYSNNSFIPQACHRLDRNTTGLVVFAKNNSAKNELLYCFKHRLIDKYYLTKVYGILKQKEKLLHDYLFKDSKKNIVIISNEKKKGYEEIKTKYVVKSENTKENYSILEVELLTGKTHQIRAHLAYINHPIVGDGKYGMNDINKKYNAKTQQLCAYKIKFNTSSLDLLQYLDGKTFEISCEL